MRWYQKGKRRTKGLFKHFTSFISAFHFFNNLIAPRSTIFRKRAQKREFLHPAKNKKK